MDTLLIAVAGLSLAMAIGMAVLLLKLLREERRRSDARVAALVAQVQRREAVMPRTEPTVHRAETIGQPRMPAARAESHSRSDALPVARTTAPVADLFVAAPQTSPWGTRLAVAAALVVAVAGAGYLLLPQGTRTAAAPDDRESAAVASAPLELLSLRHSQESSDLVVTGLVQNPRSGSALTGIVATASAFSADGTLLASGRAPLDFTSLAPGAESPFVVRIAVPGAVARYRIGFKTEDGGVIAHIDKRTAADALARK